MALCTFQPSQNRIRPQLLYLHCMQDLCYSFKTLARLIWHIVALVVASISDSLLFKPRYLTREKQHHAHRTQYINGILLPKLF